MEALGTLSAGIAHDFNDIIYAVNGYAELALEASLAAADRENYLNSTIKAGERAEEIIKQILTFSRKSDQEPKPLDISPVVKECLHFLREAIPSTVDIDSHMVNETPLIIATPDQIYQVFINLCSNAVHSIGQDQGMIMVSLATVDLDQEFCERESLGPSGTFVKLAVKDTGCGMSPEILARIFEPHFSTKGNGGDTGLGLPTVLGIVRSVGGTVTVDSQVDNGTTFNLFFRAVENESSAEPETEPIAGQGNAKTALCIDDEAELLPIYEGGLKKLGFHVITTHSAHEALEIFRKNPVNFDIIISDLTMPKMSGIKLAEKIHSIRPDMPIIICTGYNDFVLDPELKSVGVVDVLYKPLSRDKLASVLTRLSVS